MAARDGVARHTSALLSGLLPETRNERRAAMEHAPMASKPVLVARRGSGQRALSDPQSRFGYTVARRSTIEESYPHLAPLPATACDFVIFHKDLKVSGYVW